jgi:hypothetical protein
MNGMPSMYKGALAKGAEMRPKQGPDENPLSQDGNAFLVSPDLFPEGHECKVGDEVMVKAKVKSVGSKIALTPVEVSATSYGDDSEEEAQD